MPPYARLATPRLRRRSGLRSISEVDPQPQLDNPRRVQLRAQNAERLRRLQAHGRIRELHRVEEVEELRVEGGAPALRDPEPPRHRDVDAPARQSAQLAACAAG